MRAAGKPQDRQPEVQFSRPVRLPADPPINQGAQQQQDADERQQMPAADFFGRGGRSVPINVAGRRLTSGSKRLDRQLSHNNNPARFRMKSTMPMAANLSDNAGDSIIKAGA
jgi:hypothetical protein